MNKHLHKILVCLTCLVLGYQYGRAQVAPSVPQLKNMAFQITAGSQGFGVDFKYGITNNLSARLGGSFLPVKANNVFNFSSFESNINAKANFNNVHLYADFTPFESVSWLRLVGGAGYLFKASGNMDVIPTGSYKVANYTISKEELGLMNVDMSWKGVAPYVGLGFLNAFPKSRFNVNLDLGTYYVGAPKSTVVGTQLLAENYRLEPQLDENMKDYKWLPVMQVNFNFKIR